MYNNLCIKKRIAQLGSNRSIVQSIGFLLALALVAVTTIFGLTACTPQTATPQKPTFDTQPELDKEYAGSGQQESQQEGQQEVAVEKTDKLPDPDVLRAGLDINQDMRAGFVHGPKPASNQSYIVLHDTEGDSSPENVISWWDGNGNLVAAHFVIGKDGHIVQCVPLDNIAHHAGYGDIGHNQQFGITEDGRDDMLGSVPIGSSFPDYGMNAWSIGIEMVHIGGEGDYPAAQLEALDKLIAYLDSYYVQAGAQSGNAGTIIDHKAWRSGNSDTSAEFAGYLQNYQQARKHA